MLAEGPVSLTLADPCTLLIPAGRCWDRRAWLYLPLDHVGERRSPKLREFEIRQVGFGREGVLIIGAMSLSCRSVCIIRCTQRWVRAPTLRAVEGLPAERACTCHLWRPKVWAMH